MSGQIKIYNRNLKALGSTSKAFNIEKKEELMREYILSFSVVNNDSIFKYFSENTVFQYGGQYFDIAGIDGDSGTTNITQITSEHVSYRLADYTLPNGYSFVGTVQEIAQDILNEAKTVDEIPASTVFNIGKTADLGTLSFSMRGAINVTAREALIAMSKLGVEISFDNFTIHLPERLGADNGLKFKYGLNLNGVHRTWQKGNGWSYDVKIVDIAKQTGQDAHAISIGDNVTVEDTYSDIVLKERVISYTECDDPTQNHITVGVFIRDNASLSIETDRIANTANATANSAKETADNSVQQGKKYSNVSITHKDGFMAENKAGTQRVMMNADDCFVVQVLKNGKWVTVNSVEVFGMLTERLTNQEAKNLFYVSVGKIDEKSYGLELHRIYAGIDTVVARIGQLDGLGNLIIEATESPITLKSPHAISVEDEDGNLKIINSVGYSGSIQFKTIDDRIGLINVSNGEIGSVTLPD